MDASTLERIEARVAALERRVKGDLPDNDQTVVQRLAIIDSKLTATIQDKESLGILGRTDALDALLDPSLERSVGLDNSAKLALVEANADRVKEAAEMLEKIESLKIVLESAHIKSVPMHSAKLAATELTQAEQLQQVEDLTRRAMTMFETYNRIMTDISKKFSVWDQRLAATEERIRAAKQAK